MGEHANPVSADGGKYCVVYSLAYKEVIEVVDDDRIPVGRFPVTYMSSGVVRMQYGEDVDKVPWLITLTGMCISMHMQTAKRMVQGVEANGR